MTTTEPGSTMTSGGTMRAMLGRDSLYMIVSAGQALLALVLTPVTTHLLGADQFGRLSAATTLLQVLVAVGNLGLHFAIQREYFLVDGLRRVAGLYATAIGFALIMSSALEVSVSGWSGALGFSGGQRVAELTVLYAGLAAVTLVSLAVLRCAERLGIFALVSLLQSVGGQVIGIGLAVEGHRSAYDYVGGLAIGQLLALAVATCWVRPRLGRWTSSAQIRAALRFCVPMMPLQVGTFVLAAGDRLVVQRDMGATSVGRYQVAYNIGSLSVVLLSFLSAAWIPRLFALSGDVLRLQVLAVSRDALYRILLPVTLGTCIVAPLFLQVWVPASYQRGGLPIIVTLVAMSAFPAWSASAWQRAQLTSSHTSLMALATLTAAALNVALNLVLVPVIGLIGSALATLVTYGVQSSLNRLASRRLGIVLSPSPVVLFGAIAVVCGLCLGAVALPGGPVADGIRVVGTGACLWWFVMAVRCGGRGATEPEAVATSGTEVGRLRTPAQRMAFEVLPLDRFGVKAR